MKVHATGRMLNTPQETVNYLTFSAEDDDERKILSQLFSAWQAGSLAMLLGEQVDLDSAAPSDKCRRCTDCEGEEHHWMVECDDDRPQGVMGCKHCLATRPITDADLEDFD